MKKIQIAIFALFLLLFVSIVTASAGKEVKIFRPETTLKTKDPIKSQINEFNEHKRIILESISEKDINQLMKKGCSIRKRLRQSTSFKCPENTVSDLISLDSNVREARIFHIVDLDADKQINADDVWAAGINGTGVNIAILDTGVDANHVELNGSILGCENFVSGETCDDLHGHGTHVTGVITADGVNQNLDNGNDATGVAPGAGVYMLKVCDASGSCNEDDVMAAMDYAIDNLDVKVMSLSLGGGNFSGLNCDFDPIAAKVNDVVDNGISVVVASGNDGFYVSFPACASKAIAVGAVDENGFVPSWSNYGPSLDIVAPSNNILSTYSCSAAGDCGSTWYAYMTGTSLSTPHVSGVIALLLEANSSLNDTEIKDALYSTADPAAGCYRPNLKNCTSDDEGAGIVNAYRAYLSVICVEADLDCDHCVNMNELLTYIGLWKADPVGVGMNNLLSTIGIWKSNPTCT